MKDLQPRHTQAKILLFFSVTSALFIVNGRAWGQSNFGNQPDPGRTQTGMCTEGCFTKDQSCSQDDQCCDASGDDDTDLQCNSSGKCEPEGVTGDRCANNHDCQEGDECDFYICQPVNCTCEPTGGSTCFNEPLFICSGGKCIVGMTAPAGSKDDCADTGQCDDPCDDASCDGYDAAACNTCATDDDCPGGLVCTGGSCGCSDPCDDTSCSGYTYCGCNNDVVECDCPSNQCVSTSCPDYYNDGCDVGNGSGEPCGGPPGCDDDNDVCDENSCCSYDQNACDSEYGGCDGGDDGGDFRKVPGGLPRQESDPNMAPPLLDLAHPMCRATPLRVSPAPDIESKMSLA
jgi:hypothetical protein